MYAKRLKKAENTIGRVNLIVDVKPTILMAPKWVFWDAEEIS